MYMILRRMSIEAEGLEAESTGDGMKPTFMSPSISGILNVYIDFPNPKSGAGETASVLQTTWNFSRCRAYRCKGGRSKWMRTAMKDGSQPFGVASASRVARTIARTMNKSSHPCARRTTQRTYRRSAEQVQEKAWEASLWQIRASLSGKDQ